MIEAITIYDINNKKSLLLSQADSIRDFVLESCDFGEVKAKFATYKYLNQYGETVTNTSIETRDVEVVGWLVANSEKQMTERKKIVNALINPLHQYYIYYKDYKMLVQFENSVQYSTSYDDNNDIMCKFKLSGFAPDALFSQKLESVTKVANLIGVFHFPLIIPATGMIMSYKTPSVIAKVINKGSVDVGLRFVFRAKGSLSNPSLFDIKNQVQFKINKDMVAGEEIEVNTNIGIKRVTGKLNNIQSNYFKYRDLSSKWLQAFVGENLYRYNADTGIDNLELDIYIYNKYLEVQECI